MIAFEILPENSGVVPNPAVISGRKTTAYPGGQAREVVTTE